MNVYVDTSVVLRVVFGEPGRLRGWRRIVRPLSSELIRVECLRTIDRARLTGVLGDDEVAAAREAVEELLETFDLVALDRRVLRRASEPLPTTLGTLDAIHLATATALRARVPDLRLATHDQALAVAARAVGLAIVSLARESTHATRQHDGYRAPTFASGYDEVVPSPPDMRTNRRGSSFIAFDGHRSS